MLSVDHAEVLDRYRTGMRTEQRWRDSGSTDTEELRQAMQHYRSVFETVVGETADAYPGNGDGNSNADSDGTASSGVTRKGRVRQTPAE
jgi:hypothetical protein